MAPRHGGVLALGSQSYLFRRHLDPPGTHPSPTHTFSGSDPPVWAAPGRANGALERPTDQRTQRMCKHTGSRCVKQKTSCRRCRSLPSRGEFFHQPTSLFRFLKVHLNIQRTAGSHKQSLRWPHVIHCLSCRPRSMFPVRSLRAGWQ